MTRFRIVGIDEVDDTTRVLTLEYSGRRWWAPWSTWRRREPVFERTTIRTSAYSSIPESIDYFNEAGEKLSDSRLPVLVAVYDALDARDRRALGEEPKQLGPAASPAGSEIGKARALVATKLAAAIDTGGAFRDVRCAACNHGEIFHGAYGCTGCPDNRRCTRYVRR